VGVARRATWGAGVSDTAGGGRGTYGNEGSDDEGVVVAQDLVVGAFEADVEIEVGVVVEHGEGAADIAVAPGSG